MTNDTKFKNLYDNYFATVFRFVYSKIPLREDAEDIVADTFVDTWKMIENIDDSRNTKALLLKIASNKTNDFLRKKYAVKDKEAVIEEEYWESHVEKEDDTESMTKESVSMIQKTIYQLLPKLSEQYQKLFTLKYIEKRTYSEIAKELEITKNYAKVMHNRLIKQLQKSWNEQTI